jgi:hypothetical protein
MAGVDGGGAAARFVNDVSIRRDGLSRVFSPLMQRALRPDECAHVEIRF